MGRAEGENALKAAGGCGSPSFRIPREVLRQTIELAGTAMHHPPDGVARQGFELEDDSGVIRYSWALLSDTQGAFV